LRESDARLEVLHRQRVPAVRRVRELLRAAILSGEHRGGPFPAEQELMAQFGVSRGVIRDVLALLRAEGLIERLQGAGTFVVTPGLSARDIDALDTRLEAADHARVVREVITVEALPAPGYVAGRLDLAVGDPVVYHERVNLLDGQPVTLRSGWMPADVGAALLDHHDELGVPVLYLIETLLGRRVACGELMVEACLADAATAGALGVAEGAPLVLVERLVRDDQGRALELSFSRIRGDRLYLRTVLRRDPGRDGALRSGGALAVASGAGAVDARADGAEGSQFDHAALRSGRSPAHGTPPHLA